VRRVRLWGTAFAVLGVTTIVALAASNPRDTSLDWFLMGAAAVVSVTWAIETTNYHKEK
jgi:hypothetical protein